MTERQKSIVARVLTEGEVKGGWCREAFGVAYQTVCRDLKGLLDLGILDQIGKGRSTRYVLSKRSV
jgi:predicted HTH transcriptional regulator